MAEANLHLEIGPQYVEAAKQAVENAIAPYRTVAEYRIRADASVASGNWWPYVEHLPCEQDIWNGRHADGDGLNAAELLKLIAAHQCPNVGDRG